MRQSIRALGWTITISLLLLLVFLATAFYSVYQTLGASRDIGFGEFQHSFLDGKVVLSMPITVNNTGYYGMTEFNVTTTLKDHSGMTLATNSTEIPEIGTGQNESTLLNMSLGLADLLSNMTNLLFNDTELSLDFAISFRYAYAFGLQISMGNMSIPWGAPLYGLDLKEAGPPDFNGTHLQMNVTLEVENHSFLDIAGTVNFRVYNEEGKRIGSGRVLLHVPSNSRLSGPIQVTSEIESPLDFTGKGYLEAYLDLPIIDGSLELGRLDYGQDR